MLTDDIAFFKNLKNPTRLPTPAQEADITSYDLWSDIDLHSPLPAPMTCQCHNPFCENHAPYDSEALTPSLDQQPHKPENHTIPTSHPIDSSENQHKLTIFEDNSPKTVVICGVPKDSSLMRRRRARTRKDICSLIASRAQKRQALTRFEATSLPRILICGRPFDSSLCRRRRARAQGGVDGRAGRGRGDWT